MRTALITGSTSGIGQGIASKLASQGYQLVINGLGEAAQIEHDCEQLRRHHAVEVMYHPADLSQSEQIEDMSEQALGRFGAIDVLINSAGIQFVAPVDEFPQDKWDAILAINLSASFHTMRLALPAMKRKGWGRIISIASAHALVASPFKSAYVAAKHGIAGLTKSVALEVATLGITVNAICPGYVWTSLVEKQIPATAAARGLSHEQVINQVLLAAQPTKQFVSIEQVAAFASFLVSDAAASITGSMLPIDGGWTCQ